MPARHPTSVIRPLSAVLLLIALSGCGSAWVPLATATLGFGTKAMQLDEYLIKAKEAKQP